jgi:hypothetical protein
MIRSICYSFATEKRASINWRLSLDVNMGSIEAKSSIFR